MGDTRSRVIEAAEIAGGAYTLTITETKKLHENGRWYARYALRCEYVREPLTGMGVTPFETVEAIDWLREALYRVRGPVEREQRDHNDVFDNRPRVLMRGGEAVDEPLDHLGFEEFDEVGVGEDIPF